MTLDAKLSDAKSTPGAMSGPASGKGFRVNSSGGSFKAKLMVLPVVMAAGLAWMIPSGPSDAESQPLSVHPAVVVSAQNLSWFDPAITPTEATLTTPAEENTPAETKAVQTSPVDGLKISSQSWRRGGLGSKALVTFTLRNGNDYAVNDIEILCSFTRLDGTHLTDRKQLIHDTVNMKSKRTFARMHVGFVNINANRAKCSLVAANRL